MDLDDVWRERRMTRAYLADPVEASTLETVLRAVRAAPRAGNTDALDLVVLEDRSDLDRYWAVTLPPERREQFPWPGLLRAPVLVVVVTSPSAYAERYAESDKARTGLGDGLDAWPVPYWWVDAGAAVMAMLCAATAERLGSLFFGTFDSETDVAELLSLPADARIVGVVALGHPDVEAGRRSGSASRPLRGPDSIVHRGAW